MKVSEENSHILSTNENVLVNIGAVQMQNSEKLSVIKIDSKLNFKDYIGRICTKSPPQIKCFDQSARLNES